MFFSKNFSILIICFNPSKDDILNIQNNISLFESGIIVWNSKKVFNTNNPNFKEIQMEQNLGQAKALNIGFQKALEMKIDILLTLDQDSKLIVSAEEILKIINSSFKIYQRPAGFTFLSLTHLSDKKFKFKNSLPYKYLTPITSGSIYLTKVWRKLNGFKNELFIEGVDTEFAIRAKKHNFNFYKFDYPIIIHDAGIKSKRSFLTYNFFVRKHSDIRLYLQYRNNIPIFFKNIIYFPKWSLKSIINLFSKKFIISLIGSNNIFKTTFIILKGTLHGLIETTPLRKKIEKNIDLIKDLDKI